MKKIILSTVTIVFVGATLVFANAGNTNSKNEKQICPDGKVCICTPDGKCIILKQNVSTNETNTSCDIPGCICTE